MVVVLIKLIQHVQIIRDFGRSRIVSVQLMESARVVDVPDDT